MASISIPLPQSPQLRSSTDSSSFYSAAPASTLPYSYPSNYHKNGSNDENAKGTVNRRKNGDGIRIYNNSLFESLKEFTPRSAPSPSSTTNIHHSSSSSSFSSSFSPYAHTLPPPLSSSSHNNNNHHNNNNTNNKLRRSADSYASLERLSLFRNEAEREREAAIREIRAKMKEKEIKKTEGLSKRLLLLNEEKKLLSQVDDYLKLKEETDERRSQHLYKQWTEKVFAPIQKEITEQLDKRSYRQIEKRRAKGLQNYLDVVNRKKEGRIFRDIVIENDYNPFDTEAKATLRCHVPVSNDPLKADLIRNHQENLFFSQLFSKDHHSPYPSFREGLTPLMWDKLEATPHGRYHQMFIETDTEKSFDNLNTAEKNQDGRGIGSDRIYQQRISKKKPATVPAAKSSLRMDHYNIDCDPATVKAQFFQAGKKILKDGQDTRVEYNVVNNIDKPSFMLPVKQITTTVASINGEGEISSS